ncbi:amino acid adenylation domain-containing protein [Streptomyces sp. NPDC058231]|uniref:non-ribosomal peptide synthetase n=1 Tax=Streptomyces sp. NPDC058231 TaxID=3346392 RepID=UPI0036ED5E9E
MLGSQTQQGIWFTERACEVGSAYHMPLAVHLDGAVDIAALRAAVDAVLARHPLLCHAVVDRDGLPHLVPAVTPPPLSEVDGDPADVLRRETLRPFDVATGPLCRFTLVRRPGGVTLIVVAHHIVFDGGSKDVLLHDLAAGYRGTLDSKPVPFVADENDRLASALPAAREFWSEHWQGHGDLVLPGLRHGAEAPAADSVAVDLGDRLPRAAAALGVTTFELLLASWFALLHRYGNNDTVVGVDLGTRTGSSRIAIGPFVNELPVRIGRHGTFRELATAVRARLRSTYPFRTVPLGRAVPGLGPRPSVAPTSISYRRRMDDPVFDGLTTTVDWALPSHAVRATVHLQMVDDPAGLVANLQYRTDRIDDVAAARLAADLGTLLADVVERPDGQLCAVDATVTATEGPVLPVPDAAVCDLVTACAAASPDAVAVVGPDGARLTYAELDAWAGRIAAGLRDAGVRPGTPVGLSLRRSPAMVAAVLGVWRAGAAYVPLDPDHPVERRSFMLRDSGAVLLLTERGSDPVAEVPVWCVEDAPADATEPVPQATADGLAYVIYTSGSTGRPKGVAVPHRALVNVLLAVGDMLGAAPDHRWLAQTSLSFDISGLELFLPLVTGGRVVLAGDGAGRDGARVAELVDHEGVTHVQATPTGWRVLLDAGVRWPGVTGLVGGEALPLTLARELRPRLRRLLNMYGPTETTIWSTCWDVPAEPATVSLGLPLANTRVSVRDDGGVPVPDGVVGELWIGGPGVAAGYPGRDDLTAEGFPDGPDGRHYRTGDLVRRRDDELEFVGRADTQVKVRGHRVELGEVEARLNEFPTMRAAAVVLRGDDLVGYVEGVVDPAVLRTHLAQTLPDHMLPARFIPVSKWPMTANGKLDRAALPEPSPAEPALVTTDDGLLAQIGSIWREVLRVDVVGPDDDVFDLGGHSLTITQIASRVRDRLGVDVPLDQYYDAPTLAEITAVVAELRGEGEC